MVELPFLAFRFWISALTSSDSSSGFRLRLQSVASVSLTTCRAPSFGTATSQRLRFLFVSRSERRRTQQHSRASFLRMLGDIRSSTLNSNARSHPTPDRERAPTSGLKVEWSWRMELAAGQALGSTPCSLIVLDWSYLITYRLREEIILKSLK